MNNPLRYQMTEYDCGPTSMLNAVSYLFQREEIPPEIVRSIMLYCLDCFGADGACGKCGTSCTAMMFLSNWINSFGQTGHLPISSQHLSGREVNFSQNGQLRDALRRGGAAVARVDFEGWHYVLLTHTHEKDTLEMRTVYCGALMQEAEKNDKIVVVNCDLRSSMGLKPFAKKFPDREINTGIMEANACGMSAGMSAAGLIPFYNTFSVFASRRVYDQIFQSCAYAGLNVKIIGGDAGVTATSNGGTHMPFEDLGIMRVMPGITVLEPTDAVMMHSLIPQIANTYGVHYMRFPRRQVPKIYAEGSEFTIGKGVLLREGTDVTIMAYGIMVAEALKAADELVAQGIQARVVDMFTICSPLMLDVLPPATVACSSGFS